MPPAEPEGGPAAPKAPPRLLLRFSATQCEPDYTEMFMNTGGSINSAAAPDSTEIALTGSAHSTVLPVGKAACEAEIELPASQYTLVEDGVFPAIKMPSDTRVNLSTSRVGAAINGTLVLSVSGQGSDLLHRILNADHSQTGLQYASWAAHAATFGVSAARVVPCATGGKQLVASGAFPAGAVLFRFAGELSPVNIGDRSLQVGRAAHLLSVPPEEPWVYLQHSFEPTVSLIVDPVTPVATARTTEDLGDGAALTIDYTLHEWEMSGDGFVCSESGRRVRGFKHLTPSEREEALPRAAPHIREMHLAAAED